MRLQLDRMPVLPVFKWLAATGNVGEKEMLRTFNCGIGIVAVLDPQKADAAIACLTTHGEKVVPLGEVIAAEAGSAVAFAGRLDLVVAAAMTKKRVAVLISGRGSNMVALIEAAQGKDYPAEIALVLSNQPDAAGLSAPATQASSRPSSITASLATTVKHSNGRLMRSYGNIGSS